MFPFLEAHWLLSQGAQPAFPQDRFPWKPAEPWEASSAGFT